MKESLFDIFQRNRDCYDFRKDPTFEEQQNQQEARQLMADRFRVRKQAASEYVSSLIPLGNDWIGAVKHDVKELTSTLPDKAGMEAYRDGVQCFLLDVAAALRTHGKGGFLNDDYFDPVTLYRFGIENSRMDIQEELSREDAEQVVKAMKQRYSKVYYFRDLFSMFPAKYTVMGCKAKAPEPKLPDRLQKEDAQKYFSKAIELGLMDDKYKWLKGMQLLACFAREMSLKLDMGKGYNADKTKRISWRPFEDLFGIKHGKLRLNYNDIQKTGQEPSDIDLIKEVFE